MSGRRGDRAGPGIADSAAGAEDDARARAARVSFVATGGSSSLRPE